MQVHVLVPQSQQSTLKQMSLSLSQLAGVEQRSMRVDGQACDVYTLLLEDGKGHEFNIGGQSFGLWSEKGAPLLTVPIWLGAMLLPSIRLHLERHESRGVMMYLYFQSRLSRAIPVSIPIFGKIYLATGRLSEGVGS